MSRFFDWLVETVDRFRGFFGFHRLTKKGRGDDLSGHGVFWRIFYFVRPVIMLLVLIYIGTMVWRFSWVRGEDLSYPQAILMPAAPVAPSSSAGTETEPDSGTEGVRTCTRSRIVEVEQALIDMLVNQNDWAPATPQYKFGVFGLISWDATPWFDNKASFQRGVLGAVRRVSIELTDTLGRVRGTSEANQNLEDARGRLQLNDRTWYFNFEERLPFFTTDTTSTAFRDALESLGAFNDQLASCNALFDARADNLFQFLDRVTKDIGSMTDRLAKRSQGRVYDVNLNKFVPGEGNDWGFFDRRADNLFHEARGKMYAYHGLLQAARIDFGDVVDKRDLGDVWDRMEAHVAEAAALSPLIVSNGRDDGLFTPDHLSIMSQNMLRARANMTELRDILAR